MQAFTCMLQTCSFQLNSLGHVWGCTDAATSRMQNKCLQLQWDDTRKLPYQHPQSS